MIATLQKLNGRSVRMVLLGIILVVLGLMWYSYSTSISFTAGDTALTISYRTAPLLPQNVYVVNYADIERVELFPTAPPMRKVLGANIGSIRVGNFSSESVGSFKAVIDNVDRPLLYIKAKDDRAYMISPQDAAALKQTIESHK